MPDSGNGNITTEITKLTAFIDALRAVDRSASRGNVTAKPNEQAGSFQMHMAEGAYARYEDLGTSVSAEISERFHAMSHAMGIPDSNLYVTAHAFTDGGPAYARVESRNVIINSRLLGLLSTAQIVAVIGHELAHIKYHDYNTGFELADPALAKAEEARADLVGAGPEGSCEPAALASSIEALSRIDEQIFLALNPGSTNKDYRAQEENSLTHPRSEERIATLRTLPPSAGKACKSRG